MDALTAQNLRRVADFIEGLNDTRDYYDAILSYEPEPLEDGIYLAPDLLEGIERIGGVVLMDMSHAVIAALGNEPADELPPLDDEDRFALAATMLRLDPQDAAHLIQPVGRDREDSPWRRSEWDTPCSPYPQDIAVDAPYAFRHMASGCESWECWK